MANQPPMVAILADWSHLSSTQQEILDTSSLEDWDKEELLYVIGAINFSLRTPREMKRASAANEKERILKLFGMHTQWGICLADTFVDLSRNLKSDNYILFSRETLVKLLVRVMDDGVDRLDKREDISFEMFLFIIAEALRINKERNDLTEMPSRDITLDPAASVTYLSLLFSSLLFDSVTNPAYMAHRTAYMLLNNESSCISDNISLVKYAEVRFGTSISVSKLVIGLLEFLTRKPKDGEMLNHTVVYGELLSTLERLPELALGEDEDYTSTLVSLKRRPYMSRIVKGQPVLVYFDVEFVIKLLHQSLLLDMFFTQKKPLGLRIEQFRGDYGKFNECYVDYILSFFRGDLKRRHVLLTFDQLKNNKGEECCDIYFRKGTKVMISEVKTLLLTASQESASSMGELFPNGQADFFEERCGLNQLARNCREYLRIAEFDPPLGRMNTVHIYPAIIIDHKIAKHPLFRKSIEDYWQSTFAMAVFPNDTKIRVRRLNVIPQESIILSAHNIVPDKFFKKSNPKDYLVDEVFNSSGVKNDIPWLSSDLAAFTES